MSVRVIDKTPLVKLDVNVRIGVFLRLFMNDVQSVSTPITPKRRGDLRKNVLKVVTGTKARMTWGQVYAGAQEAGRTRGYPMVKYTTAGTGAHFAEKGINKAKSRDRQTFRKAGL